MNQEIFDFLGESRLSLVNTEKVTYNNTEVESHAFLSSDSTKGIIYTLLMSPVQLGSVNEIKVSAYAMGDITAVTTHYFAPSGHQLIQPTVEKNDDAFRINLNDSYALDSGKAVLITLIETQPLSENTAVASKINNDHSLLAYPNPTTGKLNILSGVCIKEIQIYSRLSKLIFNVKLEEFAKTIDISSLSKGIYILNTRLEDGTNNYQKIIVQ